MRLIFGFLFFQLAALAAWSETLQTTQGPVGITKMADGLDQPWALAFLPGDGFLVTLREGELRHYNSDGSYKRVKGLPKVFAKGQGGLLDVIVARDFPTSRLIFFSYSKKIGNGAGTILARARLSADGKNLTGLTSIFEMVTPSRGSKHFGSRIVEAPDGTLFLTLGERGDMDQAQNVRNHNGTIIRINRDGSVPGDNPDWNSAEARPEIWTIGHRNAQGLALDLNGALWAVEHGARGGDEVNLIRPGRNYGWPVIAYGRHYSGLKIGIGTHKAGMEQPAVYWDPSIAPSGLMVYSGKLWPEWRGSFFVGSLKFDYISRLDRRGSGLIEVESLKGRRTGRVRDIREAPDGTIWFLSVDEGAVFRLSPAP